MTISSSGVRGVTALLLCSLATGCGPIAAGVMATQSSGSGGGGAANTPPSLQVPAPPASPATGVVPVAFDLTDAQADVVNVVAEFAVGGGTFQTASAEAGSGVLTALASSAGGVPHTFRWDSRKDTGPRDLTGVQLRLTPFDGRAGSGVTLTLDLQNNEAPAAQLLRVTPGPGGVGFLDYIVSDSASDPAAVTVEFSLDGGASFAPATRASGTGDGVSSLATTPTGKIYSFAWSSLADAPGVRSANVVFRLTPRDAAAGAAVTLGGLAIDNSSPPRTLSVLASVGGNTVDLTYVVADDESDPVWVSLTFQADGGPVQAATNVSALFPDTSLSGQATSPAGTSHALRWNAIQLGLGAHTVLATITPTDTVGGAPASVAFNVTVAGNGAPSASLGTIARQVGVTQVTIPLTATDPDTDDVAVVASFTVAGDPTVYSATLLSQVTGLSTGAPPANDHTLVWDAQNDLVLAGHAAPVTTGVVFSLALSDGLNVGPSAATNAFTFGNAPPVVETFVQPGATSGVVPLQFTLSDSTSDPSSVAVQFKLDGEPDTAYRSIALAVGSVTGLATSPAPGTSHSIGWDTKAAPPGGLGLDNQRVIVRFTPTDGLAGGGGTGVATAAFDVSNNSPPNATVQAITRPPVPGATTLPFTLFNPEGAADPLTIQVHYSVQGGPFLLATGLSGTGPFTGSASGASYSITWDATAQLGVAPVTTDVVVRVTPIDAVQTGSAGASSPFSVGNDAPDLQIADFTGPQSGSVPFVFTLGDSSSDPAFLTFQIEVDGTPLANPTLTASPTTPFPTSDTTPLGYTIVWNAPADIPSINNNTVSVTITPTDAFGGAPVPRTLADFTLVSSNQQPVVTFPVIPRQDTDQLAFSLGVQDAEGGGVRIDGFDLRVGVGPLTSATVSSPALPLLVTGTGAGTTAGPFVWEARTDLGASARPDVRLRVRFRDQVTGLSFTKDMTAQEAFVYGNDAPVLSNIQLTGTTGNVVVRFDLSDTTSDVAAIESASFAIRPEYSVDGATWSPIVAAAIVGGVTSNLPTTPPPSANGFNFTWNTRETLAGTVQLDLATAALSSVRVRLTPLDTEPGASVTSAPFVIDNNSLPFVTLLEPAFNEDTLGRIGIQFTLHDFESDPCELLVQWRDPASTYPDLDDPSENPFVDPTSPSYVGPSVADPAVRAALRTDPEVRARLQIVDLALPTLAGAYEPAAGSLPDDELLVSALARSRVPFWSSPRVDILRGPGLGRFATGLAAPGLVAIDGPWTALVALRGSGAIVRLDLATGQPIGIVATGLSSPRAMALSSDGTGLLVLEAAGSLARIDVDSGVWTSVVAAGLVDPQGIAVLGAADAFVTQGNDVVVHVNLSSGALTRVATLGSGIGLRSIAVDRTRRRAYVALSGGGRVVSLDLTTFLATPLSAVGSPSSLALSTDRSRLYVATDEGAASRLWQIDVRDGAARLISSSLVAPLSLDVGADGAVVVTEEAAGAVSIAGGVEQSRAVDEHDLSAGRLRLDSVLSPPLGPGRSWRIDGALGPLSSSATGRTYACTALTLLTPAGPAGVVFRVTPFDARRGTAAEASLPKLLVPLFAAAPRVELRPGLASMNEPTVVATADIDGDGDIDIVAGSDFSSGSSDSTLAVFRQGPPGQFTLTQTIKPGWAVFQKPNGIALVDLDGNGSPDIVTANAGSNVTVFLQVTPGTFATSPSQDLRPGSPILYMPSGLVVADVDGDGLPDILTANGGSRNITLFRQLSPGTFEATPSQDLRPLSHQPQALAVGDLDADGDLDIVSAGGGGLAVFAQLGPGVFEAQPSQTITAMGNVAHVGLGDLDGDGDLDAVAVDQASDRLLTYLQTAPGVLSGAASQTLQPGTSTLDGPTYVSLGDLDNDGDLDLVCCSGTSHNLTVFRQVAPGIFGASPVQLLQPTGNNNTPAPNMAVLADVDRDGALDIVSANGNGDTVTVFQAAARGVLETVPVDLRPGGATADGPSAVATGDVDGDGDIDLVVANRESWDLTVYLQAAPGAFTPSSDQGGSLDAGVWPNSVRLGDVDGDGDLDILTGSATGARLLRQTTPGRFEAVLSRDARSGVVEFADIDGDGDLDIVGTHISSDLQTDAVKVWRQTAAGTFEVNPGHLILPGPSTFSRSNGLAVGDLGGEGAMDIVTNSTDHNTILVFRQVNGAFSNVPSQSWSPSTLLQTLRLVDLDRDDRLELLATTGSSIRIFRQLQSGAFDVTPLATLSVGFGSDIAVGDLDGDGALDVVATSLSSNLARVWLQSAPGVFVQTMTLQPGTSVMQGPRGLALGDLNSDGELDLVTANYYSDNLTVFFRPRR